MARILLADDDKGSLDLVRRALQIEGHTVVTAEDGSEALALVQPGGFDLLVTDVQMPGLDGIELARRASAQFPAMRFVLMSAYPDGLDHAAGLAAKGARLVTKPFTIDKIRAEVRAALA
jgi:two-component system, cell cycle response regulator CpdR